MKVVVVVMTVLITNIYQHSLSFVGIRSCTRSGGASCTRSRVFGDP